MELSALLVSSKDTKCSLWCHKNSWIYLASTFETDDNCSIWLFAQHYSRWSLSTGWKLVMYASDDMHLCPTRDTPIPFPSHFRLQLLSYPWSVSLRAQANTSTMHRCIHRIYTETAFAAATCTSCPGKKSLISNQLWLHDYWLWE